MHAIIWHLATAIGKKCDVLAVIRIIISCGLIGDLLNRDNYSCCGGQGMCNCVVRYFYIIYIIYIII